MKKIRLQKMIRFISTAVISSMVIAGNTPYAAFGTSMAQQEQTESGIDDSGQSEDHPEKDPADNETDKDNGDEDNKEEIKEPKLKKPVLYAASKPDGQIKISWNKINNAAEYVLFRSTEKNGDFSKIYTTTKTCHYIDEKCTAGQKYYYQLTAFTKGRTQQSDSKKTAGRSLDKVKLTEISNLSGSRKMVLHWKNVKGASGYQIKRKSKSGEYETAAVVKGKKTSFTDKKLSGGTIYSYRICALDASGGRGNYSNALSQMAIDADKKMIALTYDDGPSLYTPIVLDALEKYEAHATFFVVGNRVNQFSNSIRREAALGCEIGNHTYSHNTLSSLSTAQVQSVLNETNRVVKQQAGVDIHIMRPPGGSYNSTVCAAANMPAVLWSIDTLDWRTRSTSATIQCVDQKAYDGAIVLMHDLHQPTANAAATVISHLKNAGYQIVTVSELAAYRGGMAAGKVYSQFRK